MIQTSDTFLNGRKLPYGVIVPGKSKLLLDARRKWIVTTYGDGPEIQWAWGNAEGTRWIPWHPSHPVVYSFEDENVALAFALRWSGASE